MNQPDHSARQFESEQEDFQQIEQEISDRLDRLWQTQSPMPDGNRNELTGLIDSRYRLISCIGSGSFGLVYRAFDEEKRITVAIKLPRAEVLLATDQMNRFKREAAIAMRLRHDGIVLVLDSNFQSITPYIVMAWCSGPNLEQFLDQQKESQSSTDWRTAARFVAKISRAIEHAHASGITHRDLKPSNILLEPAQQERPATETPSNGDSLATATTPELSSYNPKVTDFGLAHFVDVAVSDTRSSVLVGTPAYLAPEQVERFLGSHEQRSLASAADIYSLGMILFEILAQKTAVEGDSWFALMDAIRSGHRYSLTELCPHLPKSLTQICECCLSHDPAGRYESPRKLAEDLEACSEGKAVKLSRRTWWQRLRFFCLQQKRIDQAATYGVVVQLLVVLCLAGTMIAALLGIPTRPFQSGERFFMEILVLVASIHVPLGWLASKAAAGNYRAVKHAFYASAVLLAVQIALVFAIASGYWPFEFVPLYVEEPGTSKAVYIIMMVVFGIQATLFGLALPASRRWRTDR